jgi:hypothetical protein
MEKKSKKSLNKFSYKIKYLFGMRKAILANYFQKLKKSCITECLKHFYKILFPIVHGLHLLITSSHDNNFIK